MDKFQLNINLVKLHTVIYKYSRIVKVQLSKGMQLYCLSCMLL